MYAAQKLTKSATYELVLSSSSPANGWKLLDVYKTEKVDGERYILGKYDFSGVNSETFRNFRSPIILSRIEVSYRIWFFGSLNQVTDLVHLKVFDRVCNSKSFLFGQFLPKTDSYFSISTESSTK